jgi:hypothetical protein
LRYFSKSSMTMIFLAENSSIGPVSYAGSQSCQKIMKSSA